ncbi:hypothetical protein FNV43_RR23150 [Rhamnella rubrinervis]|uniref:Myosin N-terminal SH3-like domain-containing protein n=1 Tax=Rhamnella rubrinervis TaxID=2594499 RepID=A0A8K0DVL8_9ROSA|nr:hypothetical protein FNV43_RR23150 [Rhamnella rubrinervis]
MAATISPVVGSLVWVEDADVARIDGEVVEVNGEEIKVLYTSRKTFLYAVQNCRLLLKHQMFIPKMHEPGVLDKLRSGYDINEIYLKSASGRRPPSGRRRLAHEGWWWLKGGGGGALVAQGDGCCGFVGGALDKGACGWCGFVGGALDKGVCGWCTGQAGGRGCGFQGGALDKREEDGGSRRWRRPAA